MRAAVYRVPGVMDVVEVELPRVGPADVLIDVQACGVCGSDVASYLHGHYVDTGQVMGHELCGRVSEIGVEVVGLVVGTLVAVKPMRSCGNCGYCQEGSTNLCAETLGQSLGYGVLGGFCQQVLIPNVIIGRDVYPLPPSVDPLDAIWAEPLAVALHAVHLAGIDDQTPLVVLGGGSVGLCVATAALAEGCPRVTVVEPRVERREAAVSLGALAVDPAVEDACEDSLVVIDCSGSLTALEHATGSMRPGGSLVLVGLGEDPVPWGRGSVQVIGSFAYTDSEFARAVELIVSGQSLLSSLVTNVFELEDTSNAIVQSASAMTVVKVAITPNGPLTERAQ